jgi:hypothetical protein
MAYQPKNPNGQATMANSEPVVIASDQSPIDVLGPLTDVELRATPVPVDVVKDTFSQAVPIISAEHRYLHMGEVFRYYDAATLASGSSQDYLFTTPDTTLSIHLLLHIDGSAITSFSLFEDSDKTGTTLQTIVNANRNSTNTSTMTIHKGVSGGTTDGTHLVYYASGSAGGNSKSPAIFDYVSEWVLKRNSKYIIRITSGTNGNLCNLVTEWYEHVSGT